MKTATLVIVILALALVIYNNFFTFLEFAGKDFWMWFGYFLTIGALLFYFNVNKEHFKKLFQ